MTNPIAVSLVTAVSAFLLMALIAGLCACLIRLIVAMLARSSISKPGVTAAPAAAAVPAATGNIRAQHHMSQLPR